VLIVAFTLFGPDSLQPLFKHVESGSEIREKIICFLRDKVSDYIHRLQDLWLPNLFPSYYELFFQVFPVKSELLKPQAEMERYITDLIKKVCTVAFLSFFI
jgi:hypothetical protein